MLSRLAIHTSAVRPRYRSRFAHFRLQDYFNDNPAADNMSKVKGQIEDVKGVMVENIEKVG